MRIKNKAAKKEIRMGIIIKIILSLAFLIAFLISLIPVTIGIYNIGVYVSVGGFFAAFLITAFWQPFVSAVKSAFAIPAFKWILSIAFALLGIMLLFAVIISVMMLCSINNAPAQSGGTVIVLGCEVRGERPSRMLANRLDKAYEYLSQSPDSKCIVSGGQGSREKISEAEAMKRYLAEKGISQDRIILEDRSSSTFENLQFSKQIMDKNGISGEVIIVTDGFHEWRAQYIAKKLGMAATGYGAEPYYPLEMCFWVREIFGIVRVVLLGY